jgi:hypothetical protein
MIVIILTRPAPKGMIQSVWKKHFDPRVIANIFDRELDEDFLDKLPRLEL